MIFIASECYHGAHLLVYANQSSGLRLIRFTRLPKPRTSFGGLFRLANYDQNRWYNVSCRTSAYWRHERIPAAVPLPLDDDLCAKRPFHDCKKPARLVAERRRLGVCLKSVGCWELLLPFTHILGCSGLDTLVSLEWAVCPRIFPRHFATTSSRTFTLFVLFSGYGH